MPYPVTSVVADLLVTAATGKTLRVAVHGRYPHQRAFAEQLTRALHARGRACRCLTPSPTVTADARPAARGDERDPAVAVITGGAPGLDDSDLCRINIRLRTPTLIPTAGGDDADIVVDYVNPDGPTIRHVRSVLSA